MRHLFCFGLGYSAGVLAERLLARGWAVSGTATTAPQVASLAARGFAAFLFDGATADDGISGALARATHLLASVPPGAGGDPVLARFAQAIGAADRLAWIGYLSTVGVYGDRQGAWVDEASPTRPSAPRSIRRLAAERAWLAAGARSRKRVVLFRLAGIYGPGRSAIDAVRAGTARRIVQPGQVFNRIHVADLASALEAAAAGRGRHDLYNVADDEPAPPQDVVAYAAGLLGRPPPPAVALADAGLAPLAASFYAESKRVSNTRMKEDLGVVLAYPTYREGLSALARA